MESSSEGDNSQETSSENEVDVEPSQKRRLTQEDIEAFQQIPDYSNQKAEREKIVPTKSRPYNIDAAREQTSITMYATFKGLIKQYGQDMFDDIEILVQKILEGIKADKVQHYNSSTTEKRLLALWKYIEFHPDIFERCSGLDMTNNEAIDLVKDTLLQIRGQNIENNKNRTLSAKERESIVRMKILRKAFYTYQKHNKLNRETQEYQSNELEILQNLFIGGIYTAYIVRRLEVMKTISLVVFHSDVKDKLREEYPNKYISSETSEQHDQRFENYVFVNNEATYIVYNQYKTANIREKRRKEIRLRKSERDVHRKILAILEKREPTGQWQYLLNINKGAKVNATIRVQQTFIQICGQPFSVDTIRKMAALERQRMRKQTKEQIEQVAKEMETSETTLHQYYRLTISPTQIKHNETTMSQFIENRGENDNEKIKLIKRNGQQKRIPSQQREICKKILIATRGKKWDIPKIRPKWEEFVKSSSKVDVNNISYTISEVFMDIKISYIKALASEIRAAD